MPGAHTLPDFPKVGHQLLHVKAVRSLRRIGSGRDSPEPRAMVRIPLGMRADRPGADPEMPRACDAVTKFLIW
jgi:hypothetical protein